jgi:hypothetical protein
MRLSLSDTALYFDERVDEAERVDRIVRVPLEAPDKREEIAKGKLLSWQGDGDHLLIHEADDSARFVDGSTKKSHLIGPFTSAAWTTGTLYVARPSTEKPAIVIDAIDLDDPHTSKRIGSISRSEKLGTSPNSMAASSTHVFVALDEEGAGARTPSHVFSLPLGGGDAKEIATATDLHQLVVVADTLYVGSLARAHRLDASGALTSLDGMYWDFLATDGKVAHYFVSTSLPEGGIGGYLYAWTPPAEPQRVYEKLQDPNYVVMNKTHVYWINGKDREIMRIPRTPGR